jgi:hypothetical protein
VRLYPDPGLQEERRDEDADREGAVMHERCDICGTAMARGDALRLLDYDLCRRCSKKVREFLAMMRDKEHDSEDHEG